MNHITRALVLLTIAAGPLAAQGTPVHQPLDSGTVVRLDWGGTKQVGRLLAPLERTSPAIVFCRYASSGCLQAGAAAAQTRLTQDLVQVEVRRGVRTARGALWGAGVGLAVLGIGRVAFADRDSPAPWTGERVAAAATFVALAAGIGALIGRGSDRWEAAP